jgi:serine/threonine protein kinase
MIGTTVSHYKILEKLGEGGMGVVYKAEDTKLKRTVALKFLPPELTRDPEAKERFTHEAQAASALEHPNICNIHEIGETDDGRSFIVMACYEGQTLKDKIEGGPLPFKNAIDLAIQIGQGLEKAHGKNIVHRDIKPANVMITDDGIAKILDFGLAKLRGRTVLTKTGTTLGTVTYMSPEQVKGDEIDRRSDIWSLGVVLYEMITGVVPFKGEYENAIQYSILNVRPEAITGLRSGIPLEVERIVNKCLEKDKAYRYQHIDELLTDLKRVKRDTSEVSLVTDQATAEKSTPATTAPAEVVKQRRKIYLRWSIITVFLLSVVSGIIFWPTRSSVHPNPKRISRALDLPFKEIMYPSMSADGNWIAFSARDVEGNWNVYLSHSSSGEMPRILVKGNRELIWGAEVSPDGGTILYEESSGSVRIISSTGGIPLNADSLNGADDLHWRPDGKRIGWGLGLNVWEKKHIEFWTSSPEGTDLRREFVDTIGSQLFRNFCFDWSPNGKSIVWIRDYREGSWYQELFVHDLETGKERQLTFAKANIEGVCWSQDNVIIYSTTVSGPLNLWMISSEGGDPTQLTSSDGPDGSPRISSDGRRIIYPQVKMVGQIMLVPVTGGEPKLVTAGEQTVWDDALHLSPDGRRIAVNVGDLRFGWSGVRSHLFIMDRDGTNRQRVKIGEWENTGGRTWSPNGKWLAATSGPFFTIPGAREVFILDMTQGGQPKRISTFNDFKGLTWVDSSHLTIRTKDKFSTVSPLDSTMKEDTLLRYPIGGRNEFLTQDLGGSWWINSNGQKRKLEQPPNSQISLRQQCWTEWEAGQPFRTISLTDGRIKEFNSLKNISHSEYNLSDDGKEVIFATHEFQGKILIIENPYIK